MRNIFKAIGFSVGLHGAAMLVLATVDVDRAPTINALGDAFLWPGFNFPARLAQAVHNPVALAVGLLWNVLIYGAAILLFLQWRQRRMRGRSR